MVKKFICLYAVSFNPPLQQLVCRSSEASSGKKTPRDITPEIAGAQSAWSWHVEGSLCVKLPYQGGLNLLIQKKGVQRVGKAGDGAPEKSDVFGVFFQKQ